MLFEVGPGAAGGLARGARGDDLPVQDRRTGGLRTRPRSPGTTSAHSPFEALTWTAFILRAALLS